MSILRVHKHPRGYVQIDRRLVDDTRLSWAARGLLAYLLARPDDWQVRLRHLTDQSPGSNYEVRKLLRELAGLDYAACLPRQQPDGTLAGSEWVIYEHPAHRDTTPDTPSDDASALTPPPDPTPPDRPADRAPARSARSPSPGDPPTPADPAPLPKQNPMLPTPDSRSKPDQPQPLASVLRILPPPAAPAPTTPTDARTAEAAAAEEKSEDLLAALTRRGIDTPVARRLVRRFPATRIRRQVANYDHERPDSPGWLVRAIEADYADRTPRKAPSLLTYQEARTHYTTRTGGGDPTRPFSHFFETVRQPDGTARFRPRS